VTSVVASTIPGAVMNGSALAKRRAMVSRTTNRPAADPAPRLRVADTATDIAPSGPPPIETAERDRDVFTGGPEVVQIGPPTVAGDEWLSIAIPLAPIDDRAALPDWSAYLQQRDPDLAAKFKRALCDAGMTIADLVDFAERVDSFVFSKPDGMVSGAELSDYVRLQHGVRDLDQAQSCDPAFLADFRAFRLLRDFVVQPASSDPAFAEKALVRTVKLQVGQLPAPLRLDGTTLGDFKFRGAIYTGSMSPKPSHYQYDVPLDVVIGHAKKAGGNLAKYAWTKLRDKTFCDPDGRQWVALALPVRRSPWGMSASLAVGPLSEGKYTEDRLSRFLRKPEWLRR